MWKSDWEVRQEGERAYKYNRWSERNPYDRYGDYEESEHHKLWDRGWRDAEYHERQRKEEERQQEAYERQCQERREMECLQEEEYWEQMRQEDEYHQQQEDEST